MHLGVVRLQPRANPQFRNGTIGVPLHREGVAQLDVRRRVGGIETGRFPQVRQCLRHPPVLGQDHREVVVNGGRGRGDAERFIELAHAVVDLAEVAEHEAES